MSIFSRIAAAANAFRATDSVGIIGGVPSSAGSVISSWDDLYTTGQGTPHVSATAAVQFALGLVRRAFMVAEVTPGRIETAALTPSTLAMAAGQLLLTGNSLSEIRVRLTEGLNLQPIPAFKVQNGLSLPRDWRYECKWLDEDGNEVDRTLPALSVVHVRYGATAAAPWLGISPLAAAGLDATALANIVQKLGHDAATPVAQIIPTPDGATTAQRQGLARDIRDARGRVIVPESMGGGWGQGAIAAPQRDTEPRRVGPAPDANALALAKDEAMAIMSVLGISPALYVGAGGALREAYRQFYAATCAPLARLIQAELREKLGVPDLLISLDDLAAIDIAARARAFGTLRQGGISAQQAVEMAGWKNITVQMEEEFEEPTPPA